MIAQSNHESAIHHWDARLKLVSLLAWAFTTAFLHHELLLTLSLLGGIILLYLSGIALTDVAKRLAIVILFFIPCFILLPVQVQWQNASWVINYETTGLQLALVLTLRALAMVSITWALFASTPLPVLLSAAERVYVPKLFTQSTLLAYRYIYTLSMEWARVRQALAIRGFQNRFNLRSYKALANVIGMMVVNCIERTGRVHQAMLCRGYRGEIKTLHTFKTNRRDWQTALACVSIPVALLILELQFIT